MASCMDTLSKFHAVFSSSTLIRLDKDAFEGHLCQTDNNFVKQNKSSLGSRVHDTRIMLHLAALKRIPHVLYLIVVRPHIIIN